MSDLEVFELDQRMEFLIRFVGLDLANLRQGDQLNLQDDIKRFLGSVPAPGEVVVSFKEQDVERYPEKSVRSLQGLVRTFLSQVANASKDRTGKLQSLGIPTSLALRADFRVIRDPGDFVLLNVSGNLTDIFLFKTLFLLFQARIEPIRECPECGKIFYRRDARQKFCRRRCANLAATKRFVERRKKKRGK